MAVYITDMASFLPNEPVANDQMEKLLGMVNQLPSRTRRIILRNNKIEKRHYAINPENGNQTHNNIQLTAEAVRALKPYPSFTPADIECLCCGTSSPDQLMPGHAPMVHGELGGHPCEVLSAAGICVAGMSALKYAWLNIAAGQTINAVATGSELASSFMRSSFCKPASSEKIAQLDSQEVLTFDTDFLRWMLSDGAGAAFLSNKAAESGLSLRVEWIELLSFAHELEPCMYAGANKNEDGSLQGWRDQESMAAAINNGTFTVKQDVKLLNKEIIKTAVDRTLPSLIAKHQLHPEQIDWFLPHYSSDYFRKGLHDRMAEIGFAIPFERWYTNLSQKGNTGSASIYIILEELFHSGKLKEGEKVLCFIPESGRFSMSYMLLTVC
jgi:3-oxoacyl-[acyl-carrier-protein] synthase III